MNAGPGGYPKLRSRSRADRRPSHSQIFFSPGAFSGRVAFLSIGFPLQLQWLPGPTRLQASHLFPMGPGGGQKFGAFGFGTGGPQHGSFRTFRKIFFRTPSRGWSKIWSHSIGPRWARSKKNVAKLAEAIFHARLAQKFCREIQGGGGR
jgi:hypothetical protein